MGRKRRTEYLAYLAPGQGTGVRHRGANPAALRKANLRCFACQQCGFLVRLASAYAAAQGRGSLRVGDACTSKLCVAPGNWRSRFWRIQRDWAVGLVDGDGQMVAPPRVLHQNPLTQIVGTARRHIVSLRSIRRVLIVKECL